MAKDEMYNRIVKEYEKCGSVKQTAINAGTTLVRAQRVLITEGLWHSETSAKVGELFSMGKTTQEIADELVVSVKTVQAYLPYSKGFYSETNKSIDAQKSGSYRKRNQKAVSKQVNHVNRTAKKALSESTKSLRNDVRDWNNKINSVMKLRLELILDDDPVEKALLHTYGRVKKGIIRDVVVPSNISLHRLNYAIQRAFGWRNCHFHHFAVPGQVLADLTDGEYDGKEDERDSIQMGSYQKWAEYCGTYFRFPTNDLDDVYWDDDYDGSVSIRTWQKRKYNASNNYYGNVEHFVIARREALSLLNEDPEIITRESFFDREARKHNVYNRVEIKKATISDAELYLGADLGTLLERLSLDEVLRAPFEKKTTKAELNKMMNERLCLYEEACKKNRRDEDGLSAAASGAQWAEDKARVLPITDELIYRYAYGAGWGVKITCEEKYSISDRMDEASNGFVSVPLDDQKWIDEAKVIDHRGNSVDEVLRSSVATVFYNGQVKCVYSDGLSVMDDVEGVYGYTKFLVTLHEGTPEERAECKEGASIMGWTGRMMKAEKML